MTEFQPNGLPRRRFLTTSLAAGAALAAGGAQAARPALDLATPEARLRAYMRMRGAVDDRLVIGFISGRYYGVVGEEIKPLYGVVGATFARFRLRADGGYDGATYEIPFFTDLETGAALDTFHNPYTGETVEVVNSGYPPSLFTVTGSLEIVIPKPFPGLVVRDKVIAIQTSGSDVWMTEETTSALTIPGAPKPVRYSETTSLHALQADLLRAGVQSVPCQTAYTSIVSWRPWLKMGDHPGHLMGNGVGRYGMTLAELPQNWRAAVASRRPEVLQDPAKPLNVLFGK
jgi:hypothetical protein